MNKKFSLIVVLISILFYSCAPTTSLIKTTNEYRITYPEKSRLFADYNLPDNDNPIIKVKISKDYLSYKVFTHHYETLRNDKKGTQALIGAGLLGIAVGLGIVLDNNKESNDTAKVTLLALGAIGAGVGGIYLLVAPIPKDYSTKDSIDYKDSIYSFKKEVKSKQIIFKSKNNGNPRYMDTNNNGEIFLDIRDFYDNLPSDSSLKISVSDISKATPTLLTINSNFVSRILKNETEAENIYSKANSKIKEGKFIEANNLFSEIYSKYPYTKFFESSKTMMKSIEGNIKEEKLELARTNFRLVSDSKVPVAFDNAGITSSELEEIGSRIDRMSRTNITFVIVNGLGMELDRNQAESEFYFLNKSQKIYAIIAAAENISKMQERQKWEVLNSILGVGEYLAKKIANIDSKRLLSK